MNGCERIKALIRFLSYTEKTPQGCDVWIGAQSRGGPGKENRIQRGGPYGSFFIHKAYGVVRAHIAAAYFAGKIESPRVPEGQHIDHHCQTGTLCVSCLKVIEEAENLSLSRTRRPDPDLVRDAKRRAAMARKRRERSQRAKQSSRTAKKVLD